MEDLNLETSKWSFFERLIFRFFFVLFMLLILAYPNGALPVISSMYGNYVAQLQALVLWLGKLLLNGTIVTQPNRTGSGDTTFNYVLLLAINIFTVLTTIIWSFLDRHRASYQKMLYFLSLLVRAYVGFMMINYGFSKLFNLQFGDISDYRLKSTYGESSPMGLAWTFFAYSTGYKYFMGLAEIIGGLLLFFRRTTSLGAVIVLSVTANIMAVNYFFDVPVKIVSTILVAMSLFLILRDAKRFLNFFLLNKATEPVNLGSFNGKKHPLLLTGLKFALIIYFLFPVYNIYASRKNYISISGIYKVKSSSPNSFFKNDSLKWKEVNIKNDSIVVLMADNRSVKYLCNIDNSDQSIVVFNNEANGHPEEFIYRYTTPDVLLINSKLGLNKKIVEIKLQKTGKTQSVLLGRGFHWISEYPYNR